MYKILIVFGFIFCIACNTNERKKSSFSNTKPELKKTNESISKVNKISIEQRNDFEVIKIDSLKTFYVIYTKKKGINYKIVSERIALSKNCNKITKGDFLSLELTSIVPDTSKISYKIGGVGYNGVEIEFEGDSILDIYETKDLKGLCYTKKNDLKSTGSN